MASEWLNWCEYSYKYALECHPNNYKGNIRTNIYETWGESDLEGMADTEESCQIGNSVFIL